MQLGGKISLALLVLDELPSVLDVFRKIAIRVIDVLHVRIGVIHFTG